MTDDVVGAETGASGLRTGASVAGGFMTTGIGTVGAAAIVTVVVAVPTGAVGAKAYIRSRLVGFMPTGSPSTSVKI